MIWKEALTTLNCKEPFTQEELKKAYFTAVRQHPPEKEPETFKKIRQAFELLKDGKNREDPATYLPKPRNRFSIFYFEQAQNMAKREDFEYACTLLDRALHNESEQPLLLYYLARYLLQSGHFQKGYSAARRLTQQMPDYAAGYSMMGIGAMNRGWFKKALEPCQKAYDMGDRSLAFMNAYACCLEQNGYPPAQANKIRIALVQTHAEDTDRQADNLIRENLRILLLSGNVSALDLLNCCSKYIFARHRRNMAPSWLYEPLLQCLADLEGRSVGEDILKELDSLQQNLRTREGAEKLAALIGIFCTDRRLGNHKPALRKEWKCLVYLMKYELRYSDQADLVKDARAKAALELLTHWDVLSDELSIILDEFPEIHTRYADFLDRIKNGTLKYKQAKWNSEKTESKCMKNAVLYKACAWKWDPDDPILYFSDPDDESYDDDDDDYDFDDDDDFDDDYDDDFDDAFFEEFMRHFLEEHQTGRRKGHRR